MFNHVRTLLLNTDGRQVYPATYPGEELVPAAYRPAVLPAPLAAVRALLFGSNPDRLYLNYRLRQLLTLLHANTLLANYVTAFDPRLTYWPSQRNDLYADLRQGAVLQEAGPTARLYVVGALEPDDASGRIYHQWDVQVQGAQVTVYRSSPPVSSSAAPYTVTNNLSDTHALLHSNLSCRFEPVDGARWGVTAWVKPGVSLAALLPRLDGLSAEQQAALFAGDEPLLTFRDIWEQHGEAVYRLGAAVLALAYQTDKLHA